MRSILDPASEAEVRARVAKLTATAPARWGKMSAQEMICHLTDGLRVALGEVEVTVRKNFLRHRPLRWLFVYTLPWPKGKLPTTREFQQTRPGRWEQDLEALSAKLDAFLLRGRAGKEMGPHPTFGPLETAEWGRLVLAHMDHHLRQFGV